MKLLGFDLLLFSIYISIISSKVSLDRENKVSFFVLINSGK